MLKKLKILKNHINLKKLCIDSELNYYSICKRIERNTPELTAQEEKKINSYLKKLKTLL
jgi:hypothetical protein